MHQIPHSTERKPAHQLKKMLGLAFGVAVLIGGTIGSGILRNPGTIAGMLDNKALILACWTFGGLYVLMGANCYAELATMFPKAGGSYNYVKAAFGNYAGFLTGWFDFISNGIGPAYFCILIGEYFVLLFPFLKGNEKILSVLFLAAFTLLQLTGVKAGSVVQQVTSAIKILFFTALIIACFAMDHPVVVQEIQTPANLSTPAMLLSVFAALQLVIGTYSGWNATCFFAEEDTNPGKNIPRSLFSGILIVMVIYVLINAAFMQVLPLHILATSSLAASDVAQFLFGNRGGLLITVVALFSLISILNAYMMIPARVLFGMSRDHFFVQQGSRVNKKGTPAFSLLFSAGINMLLIMIGSFNTLFGLATFMSIAVYLLVYASLIKLRKKQPALKRPYRSRGYPFTIIIQILMSCGMFAGFAFSDPKNLVIILLVTALSYPAFRIIFKNRESMEKRS